MKHSNLCFMKSPNFIVRDEPQYFDSYVTFDFTRNRVYSLDRSTIMLLQFLSNHTLCSFCIKKYLENTECVHSFEELVSKRIIIQANSKCVDKLPTFVLELNWIQKIPAESRKVAFLTSPTDVRIVITKRCNLTCIHCNVSATSLQHPDLISVDKWKVILDELEHMRVFNVVVTGGEPFAYKDFEEFFHYFGMKKFMKGILTNGMYITDEIAAYMKKYGISPVLSLDGADASTHDEFRKSKGAFNKLLNALTLLSRHGVTYNITTVLHKKNNAQIRQIVELVAHFGAKQLILQQLKPIGRGITADDCFLDQSWYDNLLSEVEQLSKEYPGIKLLLSEDDDFWNLGPKKELVRPVDSPYGTATCMAGTYGLVIDNDGTIYPCMLAMELQLHPIGSILNQSLEEIWRNHKWNIFRTQRHDDCRINQMNNMRKTGESTKKYPESNLIVD